MDENQQLDNFLLRVSLIRTYYEAICNGHLEWVLTDKKATTHTATCTNTHTHSNYIKALDTLTLQCYQQHYSKQKLLLRKICYRPKLTQLRRFSKHYDLHSFLRATAVPAGTAESAY